MSLTLSGYPLVAGAVPLATLNTYFSAIQSKFGNIDDSDIKVGANINIDKLQYQYQEMLVPLIVPAIAAGWPAAAAGTALAAVPIPGTSGDPAWTVTDIYWACTDTGDGLGQFSIYYGYYLNSVWTNLTNVALGKVITNPALGVDLPNNASVLEGGSVALAFNANPNMLALMSAGVSATTITAARSFLSVSVILRRKIKGAT